MKNLTTFRHMGVACLTTMALFAVAVDLAPWASGEDQVPQKKSATTKRPSTKAAPAETPPAKKPAKASAVSKGAASTAGKTADKPADFRKIVTVEGITEYHLSNGLKVLLFPDSSKPTVTVNLTLFVGSRHEGYGEAGMAHLLEHLLFKGTPTHPQVPKVLQERGANFNGTTWVDRTNYYETLPASDDNLEFAIRLEADRMVNSFVRAEDLKSEMTVVRNEFESGENRPASVLGQRMLSAAYEWHNYGRSTIGNRADIERVPIESLRRFYRKYYQPDNAMLVVAGRFEEKKALAAIQKYFGPIPRPERELEKTYTEEPAQDGERIVTLRRVGGVATVGVVYHIPAGSHPDYAKIDVLESTLTGSPYGVLYKSLVESKRAANVSGSAFAWHDPGVIRIMAEASKGNDPDVVLSTMLDSIDSVMKNGVNEADVERAKRQLIKQRELVAADSRRVAIELTEWAAQGDWRLYFLYRDRVEKVTLDDVNEVARKYLRRNNRTVGMYIPTTEPERIEIPQTPDLAKMIGAYKGRAKATEGEAFDVEPLKIEARLQRETLPGGTKLVLLPKKTRGEVVQMRVTVRFGDVTNLRGFATAADYLPHLMLRGTKNLSRQQFEDELDKLQARISGNGEPAGTATFTIQAKRSVLPQVLDLLRQVLREPALPEAEFEILRRGQLSALEKQLNEPNNLAGTEARRLLDPNFDEEDPRYVPSVAEELKRTRELTNQKIRTLHKNFYNGQHGEIVIVGDFDPKETIPLVSKLVADWESSKSYARIARTADKVSAGKSLQIETPDKANAMYFAVMKFPVRDDDPDYPALVLGNFILGGGSLSSRLGDRVRQKEGLSYGVGSGYQASSFDNRSAFYIYAICNPANMPKVKSAILDELNKLREKGITAKELDDAKQGWLQSQQVERASDASLARQLESNAHAVRTLKYQDDLEKKVRAVTAKQVHDAVRKHILPTQLNIVAAGDFRSGPVKEKSAGPSKPTQPKPSGK